MGIGEAVVVLNASITGDKKDCAANGPTTNCGGAATVELSKMQRMFPMKTRPELF
ncbi:hypothetical protein PYR90_02170 [Acinetobacter johnsonii]|nr:hypothetical protein PYR90_02170 [Acinetobacter johnsonii]